MAGYGAHDPPSPVTDPCLVVVVPPPTALSSLRHCRSGTDDNRGRSSLSARPRWQNEGGGTPLHHPLRVEHRRGGGNDGTGVVVPASVSASVLVDIEGSTPHVQQAVVRHRCGEVVVLLIGDDSAPSPLRSLSSSQPSVGASSMGASWTRPSQNSPAADAGHATVAAPHLWLPAPQHRTRGCSPSLKGCSPGLQLRTRVKPDALLTELQPPPA